MGEKCIYIDLDGVILNSQQKMLERKEQAGFYNHKDKEQFNSYFKLADLNNEWKYIIEDAESINNSVEIIKELEILKKRIAILTKIHTLYEMKAKIEDLRNNRKISCPILFVPPGVKKHNVVIPNGQLLIDDSKKNIDLWIENGGVGFLFDKRITNNTNDKVRSLEFLLKRWI